MKGLTFIEILVYIGLIVMVGTIIFTVFPRFRGSLLLNSAAEEGLSFIGEAKSKTLSAKNELQYGVNFSSSTVTLFSGLVYDPADSSNRQTLLPTGVEISCIQLMGGA